MRLTKFITEATTSTGLGADGLSKARLKTLIYKETKKCTHNKIYKDSYWEGPKCIWDTFDKLNLNWTMLDSKYRHDKKGRTDAKEWKFEIQWIPGHGVFMKTGGYIVAAGAGTVEDPLSKYDLVLVMF